MPKVKAIIKKELISYLYSPITYLITCIFLIFSGISFFNNSIVQGYAGVITIFISTSFYIMPFIIPILTMKLFSEEKKTGTIELLLSLPIKTYKIVLGKFLSISIIFIIIISFTTIHTTFLFAGGNPDLGITISTYIGVILQGLSLISIGMFLSILTDSQVVAAISSLALGLLLTLIDVITKYSSENIKKIFSEFSFYRHLLPFFKGVINIKSLIFFLFIIFLGIFMTINYLCNEKFRK